MIKQKSAVDKLLADQEIKRYKELLERKLSEPDPYPDNDWARSDGMANYYKKCIKLLELGCEIKPHPQGMLVNNKFIVAKRANKWKVQGKGKWYPYKTLQGFVYTYVHKDCQTQELA